MSALTDDMARLCGEIRDLHSDHAVFLQGLKGTVTGIQSEVSHMTKEFQQGREETAKQTKHDLTAFTADVRNGVSELKSEVSRMQESFRSSFNDLAHTGRSQRGAFVNDLRKNVGRLRNDLLSDVTAIRRMWSGLAPVQHAAKEKHAEEQPQEDLPDDLTRISGIGPAIQIRLNQAGIYTYAELAQCTPDQLRRALGKFAQLEDTYDWRGEAEKLS